MPDSDNWAAVAAALPMAARAERERPFWKALAAAWGWRRVVDAGCGAGFHLGMLRGLGVHAVGFDASIAVLAEHRVANLAAGDLRTPPLRAGSFDAALCLGNTISLLPDRQGQRETLAALASLVRPGGVVLLQGEDAGELVSVGALVRTRRIDANTVHVRVFERAGRRVRMLAAVVRPGEEARLAVSWLLASSPASLAKLAPGLGLLPATLPLPGPGGGASWWAAFNVSAR
ncbi:MAG: class I SAM-dependent methyltransferase [Acidobacteriia bacterium]|nr:class I SAM-dependent methyltransferase [Terriglobia bacterium]